MESEIQVGVSALRSYIDYLRDLGIYDLYQTGSSSQEESLVQWFSANASQPASRPAARSVPPVSRDGALIKSAVESRQLTPFEQATRRIVPPGPQKASEANPVSVAHAAASSTVSKLVQAEAPESDQSTAEGIHPPEMPRPHPFNELVPLPSSRVPREERAAALLSVRSNIGDCTRCPLAYAGRHTIVFADGDPNARLMFVGEGPGADEDETGVPFVGKAGQLLNNMIQAMGLQRPEVYIANIVKCRPPKNRVPEPVEANTCSQFLIEQIDIVQPEVIVALGSTAATYLLGVKQSLASLRGNWFEVRGAKCAVTYHPAFLLRDPRQKGEAWKDLQRVMAELKLKPPGRT